ncbi:hypothetical protein [Clostridium luticellarii]|jgi:hypothetical protein|uniref:Uncharacterized protein n=1 Tax=Clostridium luticellarii TaxID=1691940 RepID=A0A2T0BQ30_9CLOT|nr:hypothetical protein [Clostridium luticellarii]PRR85980.1 hypothetical protein CLLU_10080 [Clostridium luticellarii]
MGTRTFYENFSKTNFPDIKVRVWQDKSKPWVANFYIGDREGKFSDYITKQVIPKLESVKEIGTEFNFKPYSDLEVDEIPSKPEIPDNIKELALNPDNTVAGVRFKFKTAFPQLGDFKIHAPLSPGVVGIETSSDLSEKELDEIQQLGKELVSVTAGLKVFKK